ncbi:MAG: trimethylamine methyltransferase family protein, partial [Armatimonadetes bacterium]|nr:trimethylamine methyltransferase family protein [Armatimonadota bacterium]
QSPLRLGAEEAEQFLYWWERGCWVGIGHMTTAGTTAPVTLAGLVTQTLAENLALALLQSAFYGDVWWSPGMLAGVADMRTLVRPYGAPENALANMMGASMARFYGLPFFGHSGCTDAKLPSAEAAAHKAMTILPTLLAGGDAFLDAGLLSSDEVVSPIQLILDAELGSALRHMLGDFEVSEESIGFEAIRDVAPEGLFISHEHTLRWFRRELWEPQIWSREMLPSWENSGRKTDVDRALDLYREISATRPLPQCLTEDEERALLEVIRRAEASLGS